MIQGNCKGSAKHSQRHSLQRYRRLTKSQTMVKCVKRKGVPTTRCARACFFPKNQGTTTTTINDKHNPLLGYSLRVFGFAEFIVTYTKYDLYHLTRPVAAVTAVALVLVQFVRFVQCSVCSVCGEVHHQPGVVPWSNLLNQSNRIDGSFDRCSREGRHLSRWKHTGNVTI